MLAFSVGAGDTRGVLGKSDPNAELLDAAALCRHLVAEDSMHAFLADHRRDLFPDELFADLFPSGRGRPSVPADVVATVMVLQALEGLSDRDAAMALRTNIAWKVAAGLALDDTGIHYSVLTYWRTRLRNSAAPERIFDAVRAVIDATGVLKGRRRRALDSTLLDDAVATQDTVTQLVVLKITIPSVLVGIVVGSTVVNRLGADLDDDPDYLRLLEAGTVPPSDAPAEPGEPALDTNVPASGSPTAVLVFTCGLLTVLVLGLFPGLRPSVSSGGEAGRLDMPLVIPMVMFATCAVIVILCRPDLSGIPDLSVFRAGMTSAFALFGVAWLADTFIRAHQGDIVVAIRGWVVEQPWVFVVAVFVVAALTLSQSTTVRVVVPIGLAIGLSPALIVGSLPAVGGAVVLAGATGQAVAAVLFDRSGTTSLGAMLVDNSFVVPAVATVLPAVCCGFVLSHLV